MPRVYMIPSEQPNAFATGRNPKHAAVAVTEGLRKYLPEDQIRAVLAHEFAHIKNRDILVSSIAAMIAAAISAIANILQFGMIFGGGSDNRDNPLGMLGALATIIIAPIAAMILQLAVSRQREYLADATGAALIGDSKPLADALETLERGVSAIPLPVIAGNGDPVHREPAAPSRRRGPVPDAPADGGAHPPPPRAAPRVTRPEPPRSRIPGAGPLGGPAPVCVRGTRTRARRSRTPSRAGSPRASSPCPCWRGCRS